MNLQDLIMLWKDEYPCKICLVGPICNKKCDSTTKWKKRERNLFIPYIFVVASIVIIVSYFVYVFAYAAFKLGLINRNKLRAFRHLLLFKLDDDNFY